MYRTTRVVGFRPTPKAQDIIDAERRRRRTTNPKDKKALRDSSIVNYLLETRGEPSPTPRLPDNPTPIELFHKIQCPQDDQLYTLRDINEKCRGCDAERRCPVHTGAKF